MNLFRKYFKTLILVYSVLIQLSCKKSEPETINKPAEYTLKFSRNALEYVNLVQGNYLIYKDSATSNLDSVIVTTSFLENIYEPEKYEAYYGLRPAFNHENFSLTLSKYIGNTQSAWYHGEAKLWLNYYNNISTDTAAVEMKSEDHYANKYTTLLVKESNQPNYVITVEGVTYSNVVKSIYDRASLGINHPDYLKETYYWAKGIGIIKKETITTGGNVKTYNLVRHN